MSKNNLLHSTVLLNKTDNYTRFEGFDFSKLEQLSKINAKHREILRDTLEEFQRSNNTNFTRIYPAPGSN